MNMMMSNVKNSKTYVLNKCDEFVSTLDNLVLKEDLKGLMVFFTLVVSSFVCVVAAAILTSVFISFLVASGVSLLMILTTIVSVIIWIAIPVCGFVFGLISISIVWGSICVLFLAVPALLGRAYYTKRLGRVDSKFNTVRLFEQMKTYVIKKTSPIKLEKNTTTTPPTKTKTAS